MNEEQLRYLLQLINSGQGFNSGYQPPSILDVPTGSAQLAPGTGPGGRGILQSDVNQAIQTQPNMDVPPDIPAVSSPDMNQRFTDLMQLYTGNPSGLLASNDPAGQVPNDPYLPPPANPGSTPTTAPELPPGLGGPGSYPADQTPSTVATGTNPVDWSGPPNTDQWGNTYGLPSSQVPTDTQTTDPDVLPAVPMTDPTVIDPNDPNNNLTRGGISMPLYPTSGDVFPGATGRPGQFFIDAAGNMVDATGNIIKAAGTFLENAGNTLGNFFGSLGWQPPGGTTMGDTSPINEGVLASLPSGETLPQGVFSGLGSPLTPPGANNLVGLGAGTGGNLGSFSNILGNNELMHVLKFGQLPTDAFGARAGTWTPALADYWRNVFNTRGYIYPPRTPGTAPPDASGATVSHTGVTQSR